MKTYEELFKGEFSPKPEVYHHHAYYYPEPLHNPSPDQTEEKPVSRKTDENINTDKEMDTEVTPAYEIRKGLFGGTSLRRVE